MKFTSTFQTYNLPLSDSESQCSLSDSSSESTASSIERSCAAGDRMPPTATKVQEVLLKISSVAFPITYLFSSRMNVKLHIQFWGKQNYPTKHCIFIPVLSEEADPPNSSAKDPVDKRCCLGSLRCHACSKEKL